MYLNQTQIDQIVDKVVSRLQPPRVDPVPVRPTYVASSTWAQPKVDKKRKGVFSHIEEAIAASEVAYHHFAQTTLENRNHIITSVRKKCKEHIENKW